MHENFVRNKADACERIIRALERPKRKSDRYDRHMELLKSNRMSKQKDV